MITEELMFDDCHETYDDAGPWSFGDSGVDVTCTNTNHASTAFGIWICLRLRFSNLASGRVALRIMSEGEL